MRKLHAFNTSRSSATLPFSLPPPYNPNMSAPSGTQSSSRRRKRGRDNNTLIEGDPALLDTITHETIEVTTRGRKHQRRIPVEFPLQAPEILYNETQNGGSSGPSFVDSHQENCGNYEAPPMPMPMPSRQTKVGESFYER